MTLPTFFISHGGGPWPYVEELRKVHATLEASLLEIPRALPTKPDAIVVISGHWETPAFIAMSSATPPMVYDYSGFPPHTYHVRYPAAGSPALAQRIEQLLINANLPTALDAQRGFDHGTFSPLAVMYPHADIPVVQVSIKVGYEPGEHLAAGRALAALRDEKVLIIGSGLSYHNMRAMGSGAHSLSKPFDDWLQETLVKCDPVERTQRLLSWQHAPGARLSHPREDHLMPLFVAVGAAEQDAGVCIYHEDMLFGGVVASSFRFG